MHSGVLFFEILPPEVVEAARELLAELAG